MADWDTRLVISWSDSAGTEHEISPIEAFQPNFSLNAEPLHSIEATHIGVVYAPETLSYSVTVRAIGPVAAQLTQLALEGTRFNIVLKEKQGDDWGFKSLVMSNCIITNATPTSPTIQGAPTATFSGFALSASSDPKDGRKASVPV
jgi:hypothetical protein